MTKIPQVNTKVQHEKAHKGGKYTLWKKWSDSKYPQEVHLRSGRQFSSIVCIFRTLLNSRKNTAFGRKIVSKKKKFITSSSRDQPDIQTLTQMNIHFSLPRVSTSYFTVLSPASSMEIYPEYLFIQLYLCTFIFNSCIIFHPMNTGSFSPLAFKV